MTTTINIHNLQLFFNHALDVDDLLHRITQRIQNIDLPSPGDLTPATAEPLPAAPDPVTPIAPTEPPVTAGVTIAKASSTVIAQLDANDNLEFLQKQAPSLRSLPPSMVAPAEKEALFYMRFPNVAPQHRNGTRKEETEPEPATPAPGTRKPVAPKAKPNALPFEEFDRLVRAEMKRIGTGGTMPGFGLWDLQRTKTLPSMGAVLQRYKVQTTTELAAILGLNPPLGTQARTKIKAEDNADADTE